tara:strand:- start:12 stop:488 length:477 start_codon:yes stop_codon:yes gene_type:complete
MKWWLIVVVLIAGCGSNPPTFSEEAFLGAWVTEFDGEEGTKVRIIWTFESLFDGDRTVWNEIHRDDAFIRHRKGEWQVLNSSRLRVVLDSENLTVTDNYDGDPGEMNSDSTGEIVGTILWDILSALTDDEYTIDFIRDGDVLQMKWYNDEYHTYILMG